MKLFFSLVLMLAASLAHAQWNDRWDGGRGHGPGQERGPGPGYGPGRGPGYPPPPPPPPPPGDRWDGTYGPGRTMSWMEMGDFKAPKIIDREVQLEVRGAYVNEVLFRAIDNQVDVLDARAYLSNGQLIDIPYARNTVRRGSELRLLLDRRYSLRVERIVLRINSNNLIGSQGRLQVLLGIAR